MLHVRPASPLPSRLVFVSAVLLLLASLAAAQSQQPASIAAIPPALVNVKTVFLSNGGADGGLFPQPFSGDPNRGYFALFDQLKAMGKYELVSDPSQADVVMELHLLAPYGPKDMSKQLGSADPLPFFQLSIYDRSTHYVLWTITEPVEIAFKQKTHDRNFDDAIGKLVADIQALNQANTAMLYPNPPARVGVWQRPPEHK